MDASEAQARAARAEAALRVGGQARGQEDAEPGEGGADAGLWDGGPGFDHKAEASRLWRAQGGLEHGAEGEGDDPPWPLDCRTWLSAIAQQETAAADQRARDGGTPVSRLPGIAPRLANRMQRLAVAIELETLLAVATGQPWRHVRLQVKGSAGVGKTVVIELFTRATWRLFGVEEAVRNLAPTAAAAGLLPGGGTAHSFVSPPRGKDADQPLGSAPLAPRRLERLRDRVGVVPRVPIPGGEPRPVTAEELQQQTPESAAWHQSLQCRRSMRLFALHLDEQSLWSPALLAFAHQRMAEATGMPISEASFGGIPVVALCGDHFQVPSQGEGLHAADPVGCSPATREGHLLYRHDFRDVVYLTETMRQAPDEAEYLDLLLAVRRGEVTQAHWRLLNSRPDGTQAGEGWARGRRPRAARKPQPRTRSGSARAPTPAHPPPPSPRVPFRSASAW